MSVEVGSLLGRAREVVGRFAHAEAVIYIDPRDRRFRKSRRPLRGVMSTGRVDCSDSSVSDKLTGNGGNEENWIIRKQMQLWRNAKTSREDRVLIQVIQELRGLR